MAKRSEQTGNSARRLSKALRPIYNLELELGNEVAYTAEPAGTECPLCIGFKQPLHFDEIAARLVPLPTVRKWESRDPHYDIEAGFACQTTRHTLAGPIP